MPLLKILTIPDPVLSKISNFIETIDEKIKTLANDMLETLHSHKNCVGIAAPQVGKNLRMVVINVGLYPKPHHNNGELVLINPVLKLFGERKAGREGCLSIPDLTANVARSNEVSLRALDINGNIVQFETYGFEAVVLQHEIDHLDGILFLDRVVSLKTDVFRRKSY